MVEKNAASVASGLENLLSDRATAKSMGAAGKRLVKAQYSNDAVSGQLIALFNEIAPFVK